MIPKSTSLQWLSALSSLSGIHGISTVSCVITVNSSRFVCFVLDGNPTFKTALDNSVVNPILANQKGITFSASDKWTHPTVALLKEKHYTRIGLWTSLAISKTIVKLLAKYGTDCEHYLLNTNHSFVHRLTTRKLKNPC